uniref:Uncharacterized protein n=1 Tax=Papio anubis TaxID=9555 RepID=A0A8I5NP69_PAPAN
SPHFGRLRRADHLRSGVQDQLGQHSETLCLLKTQKIRWAWWWLPVIPATWEDDAGESLEPGRWRLQGAEIPPLHSSLGDSARLYLKNNNNKRKQEEAISFPFLEKNQYVIKIFIFFKTTQKVEFDFFSILSTMSVKNLSKECK